MRILDWHSLAPAERRAALQRPAQLDAAGVAAAARTIIDEVRRDGDEAVRNLTQRFDGVRIDEFAVSAREFAGAECALTAVQHAAIDKAIAMVQVFHAAQAPRPLRVETAPGVVCERISVPIRAVGLYVPAGSAPLPSTAIMLAVPAAIAACPVRIMCTAPTRSGAADPAVLVAARKAGVERVFKVGGAQAIAAMAYGTLSIPKCDKLFGPGNAWVTAAKLLVANDPAGAAADLPAGVTEVMVIADDDAHADFVAADLLAQAEHSPEAQALLVTTSAVLAHSVAGQVARQVPGLSRGAILRRSMASIRLIIVDSLDTAFDVANDYAPEHLLLEIREPRRWLGGRDCRRQGCRHRNVLCAVRIRRVSRSSASFVPADENDRYSDRIVIVRLGARLLTAVPVPRAFIKTVLQHGGGLPAHGRAAGRDRARSLHRHWRRR